MSVKGPKTMRRWFGNLASTALRPDLVAGGSPAKRERSIVETGKLDTLTHHFAKPQIGRLELLGRLMLLLAVPLLKLSGVFRPNEVSAKCVRDIGASAYLSKPSIPTLKVSDLLCDDIVVAARRTADAQDHSCFAIDKVTPIKASIAGVIAVDYVLSQLSADGSPIVIARHMPITHAWYRDAWDIHFKWCGVGDRCCLSVDVLFVCVVPRSTGVWEMPLAGAGSNNAKYLMLMWKNSFRTLTQLYRTRTFHHMQAAANALNAASEERDTALVGIDVVALRGDFEYVS